MRAEAYNSNHHFSLSDFQANVLERRVKECEHSCSAPGPFCRYTLNEAKGCFYHGAEVIEQVKDNYGNVITRKNNECGKYMAKKFVLDVLVNTAAAV